MIDPFAEHAASERRRLAAEKEAREREVMIEEITRRDMQKSLPKPPTKGYQWSGPFYKRNNT